MEFNQLVQGRKSVKSFKPQDVPQDKIDNMLNVARLAPSWGNNQCWKFVVVKSQELRTKLAETLGDTNSAKNGVKEAPIIVVTCAKPDESADVNNQEYYLVDSAIAMDHLILAAQNEGLGTCWVGEFDEYKIKSLLRVPNEYRVVALTPVGIANETPDTETKRPINEIGFWESWGNYLN